MFQVYLQHLKISKVLVSEKEPIVALNFTADIYVINRENVVWLVKYYGRDWPFDMMVIDELLSFKYLKSQRFKELRKVKPKRIVGLKCMKLSINKIIRLIIYISISMIWKV